MRKLITGLFLCVTIFSCSNGPSEVSPSKTVSSFLAASKEGNIDEVKKYITSSDVSLISLGESTLAMFDTSAGKQMKSKMAAEFKDKTKDANIEVKDETIKGDSATVNVLFDIDGNASTQPFLLVKEDGKWKISLLSTGLQNSGMKPKDLENLMNNVNIDSIRQAVTEGMKEYNKLDKDSLQKLIDDEMKGLEKLKESE